MNDEAYNLVFNTLPHGSRVWSWSRTELKLLTVLGFRLGIVADITTSTNATASLITLLHSNSPQSNPEIAHLQPSDTRPIDQSYYNNKSAILNALHSCLNMTRFTFFDTEQLPHEFPDHINYTLIIQAFYDCVTSVANWYGFNHAWSRQFRVGQKESKKLLRRLERMY